MFPTQNVCAVCKLSTHKWINSKLYPMNKKNWTLLIPQKRTSNNISAQEEYHAERIRSLSNTMTSKPRVEAVQSCVVLTIAEIIALSCAAQYHAESSRAAASRLRVEAAQDCVVLTQALSIDLSFTKQYIPYIKFLIKASIASFA
ncbi:hypothetical protein F4703DRAFT_1788143 [Phycomyces blakesleeanus]